MKYILILGLAAPVSALAQLDAASQQAVEQTQQMMNSQPDRQKYINGNHDAKAADDRAQSLAGSKENTDKMYDIAAQIIRDIATQNAGDPAKMKAAVNQANSDPEGFLNRLTPAQKAQIDALAAKIESEKPAGLGKP